MGEYIRKDDIIDATKVDGVDTADGETGKQAVKKGDYIVKGRREWDTEPRIVPAKEFESQFIQINKDKNTTEQPKQPSMQDIAHQKAKEAGF